MKLDLIVSTRSFVFSHFIDNIIACLLSYHDWKVEMLNSDPKWHDPNQDKL